MSWLQILSATLLVVVVATVLIVGLDRWSRRAARRFNDRLEEASLEELMHAGDDCGMAEEALSYGLAFTDSEAELVAVDPPLRMMEERIAIPGEALPPIPDECYSPDATPLDPIIPPERLYDASGFVTLGKLVLHDHCKELRRDGRYAEICRDCAPSLIGAAANLPQRTEP